MSAGNRPQAEARDIMLLSLAAFASAMALRMGDAMLPLFGSALALHLRARERLQTAAA